MSKLKVSLLQMEQFQKDPDKNLEILRRYMSSMPEGTDLVVLPEMWITGFMTSKEELDERLISESYKVGKVTMSELSEEYHTAIYGSLIEPLEDGTLLNSGFFFDEGGELIGYYPKHQLFGPSGEKNYFRSGKERVQITFKGFTIRLAICYDLRFPVWLRQDRSLGLYDILLFCANWPISRADHWDLLLKARAIENQAFVVGANRVGAGPKGIHYPGLSAVYDGWGETLAIGRMWYEGWISAQLEKAALSHLRASFPVLETLDSFILTD